ncbi:hypothetical protein BDW69DRAFT_169015 [Aspergillus filifer]
MALTCNNNATALYLPAVARLYGGMALLFHHISPAVMAGAVCCWAVRGVVACVPNAEKWLPLCPSLVLTESPQRRWECTKYDMYGSEESLSLGLV